MEKERAEALGPSSLHAWEDRHVLLTGPEIKSAKGTSELKFS